MNLSTITCVAIASSPYLTSLSGSIFQYPQKNTGTIYHIMFDSPHPLHARAGILRSVAARCIDAHTCENTHAHICVHAWVWCNGGWPYTWSGTLLIDLWIIIKSESTSWWNNQLIENELKSMNRKSTSWRNNLIQNATIYDKEIRKKNDMRQTCFNWSWSWKLATGSLEQETWRLELGSRS